MFSCNCSDTGYTGDTCENDIDECLVEPCKHNSTCNNLVNDYTCACHDGFTGKDCAQDILECDVNPCQNDASCYEKSNISLYDPAVLVTLPSEVQTEFSQGFSYASAAGYLCHCLDGFEGVDCETNIDECGPAPCQNGATCEDGIAKYTCECLPGFQGDQCQEDIDECALYQPCQHGQCMDKVADYDCRCDKNFGGKNCSVPLTGCTETTCLNSGECEPYLIGETDHKFNCTCKSGYDGERCQLTTAISFKGDSYVSVSSEREEGFELFFQFRTTLKNGLLAIGQGDAFFTLQLKNGKLNLHSSMLNVFDGINIGENLADTEWQRVYISVNISHLTIGVNQLQAIHQINPDQPTQTAFQETYLGGANTEASVLARDKPDHFVGCIQDISVNGRKVRETELEANTDGILQHNAEKGCGRTDQCNPNPCMNDGVCTDLWRKYSCQCNRPFLGSSCQYTYTSATFGYENTTDSQVVVDIEDPSTFRDGISLTMFIRTRQSSGLIFYLGKSDWKSLERNQIRGSLTNGTLQVDVDLGGRPKETFKLYSKRLDDGYRHFLRIHRMKNKMIVQVNSTTGNGKIGINQEVSSTESLQAEKLYLGNLLDLEPVTTTPVMVETTTLSTTLPTTTSVTPPAADAAPAPSPPPAPDRLPLSPQPRQISSSAPPDTTQEVMEAATLPPQDLATAVTSPIVSRQRRQDTAEDMDTTFFKGVIKDIRLSDGKNEERIVELFTLSIPASEVANIGPSLGPVTTANIQEGVKSDDTCRVAPCQNGGVCNVSRRSHRPGIVSITRCVPPDNTIRVPGHPH